MRVFVTGATGFVGSAIVAELLNAGHQVVGLARSEAAAAALTTAGAAVHRGALDDLNSLRHAATTADGVIHTAYASLSGDFAEAAETDLRAISAIGEVLAASDRPLVITSATTFIAPAGWPPNTTWPPRQRRGCTRQKQPQSRWPSSACGHRWCGSPPRCTAQVITASPPN